MAFNRSSHRQNVVIILSSMGFFLGGMKWLFTLNLQETAHGFNRWQLGLLPALFPSFRLKTLRFTWHRKRERRCQCDSPTPRECSPAENAYTAADQAEYQRHAPSRHCR